MDGKILAYIFLLAAVVAATYGVYQTTLIDDAQRELNVLQAQVESTASAMQQMSRTLELRKQEQAREEEQGKKMEHLQKEQETAKTDVEKAETDLKTLIAEHGKVRAEFERDIARAREETVGMEFFEMELANGSVLKNAKIQRVEEAVLTILHSQGISKIPVNDVHGKLKDRLRFGPEFALPELGPKPAPPKAKAEPQQSASPSPGPAPEKTTADKETEAKEKRILEGKGALARLKREISNMNYEVFKLNEELENRSTSAARRYHATQRKTALEQQLDASRRQLAVVESELAKLGVSVTLY